MLGQFEEALAIYRPADAPLAGDALLALGRFDAIIAKPLAPHPWQSLWQAYRGHALCLAGRPDEALRLVTAAWPVDIYEWVHHFEALLRLGRLDLFDPRSFDASLRNADDSLWTKLARRRIRADYFRLTKGEAETDLGGEYQELIDAYDRAGLPVERVLVRLGQGRVLIVDKPSRRGPVGGQRRPRNRSPSAYAALGSRCRGSIEWTQCGAPVTASRLP